MEVSKGSSGGVVALVALGLAVLMACMNDAERGQDGKVQGIIRDECGIAGGSNLFLGMDRAKTPACTDGVVDAEYLMTGRLQTLESLKVGAVLLDSGYRCPEGADPCPPVRTYRFEVDAIDSAKVEGILEIGTRGGSSAMQSYRVELKRCKGADSPIRCI